jgi:hypothetical protein
MTSMIHEARMVNSEWKNRKINQRLFGLKKGEETGGWRTLYDEELHNWCSSPSIIRIITSRRMRWADHVAHTGEKKSAYRILVKKPEVKRQTRKTRCRWEENIKMDLER